MKLDVEEMTEAILGQEEVVQEGSQENELSEIAEHYHNIIEAMKATQWKSIPSPSTFQQHPTREEIYTSVGTSLSNVAWYTDCPQTVVPDGRSQILKTSKKEGLLAQLKSMLK